eukprot:2485322-Pyramimonas_sp.AAC.1
MKLAGLAPAAAAAARRTWRRAPRPSRRPSQTRAPPPSWSRGPRCAKAYLGRAAQASAGGPSAAELD